MPDRLKVHPPAEEFSGVMETTLFSSEINVKKEEIEDVPLEDYDILESKLKVKCGEVFALFGERFILVCTFCNTSFNAMHQLGNHLCEKHAQEFIKKDDDDDIVTTVADATIESQTTRAHDNFPGTKSSESKGVSCQKQARERCGAVHESRRHSKTAQLSKSNTTDKEDEPKRQPALSPEAATPRIYCDICGVSYKNRRNLVRHQKGYSCQKRSTSAQNRVKTETAIESSFLVVVDDSKHIVTDTKERPNLNVDPLREDRLNQNLSEKIINQSGIHDQNHVTVSWDVDAYDNEAEADICFGADSTEAMELGTETSPDEVETERHISNRKYSSELKKQFHTALDFTNSNKELFCGDCNKQFSTKKAMSNHQRRHKQIKYTKVPLTEDFADNETNVAKNPDLYCNLCNRFLRNKHSLYSHSDSHDTLPMVLQGDVDFLKCKYCFKEFPKFAERKKHECTHSGPRPYECPYCHKGFASNLSRKSHYRVHTGESRHQCDRCLKAFRDNYDLRRHIKRHLNIRDVSCELCEKKFYTKNQLELHMRTHTKERPYVCEDCGKTFVVLPQLKDHQLRHTGIKNVKCDVCDRLFYSKSVLKVHMASHSDEKPFECNVCRRRFSRAKAMQKHMKLHSGVKRYVCNICGKAYAQDSGLYAHKKTHARQLK